MAVTGFQYSQPRTTVDVNADYQLRKNLSRHVNAQNLLNGPEVPLRYGPETPGYARRYQVTTYGVQLSPGLRGSF